MSHLVRLAERRHLRCGDFEGRTTRQCLEAEVRRALGALEDQGLMASQGDRFLSLALVQRAAG